MRNMCIYFKNLVESEDCLYFVRGCMSHIVLVCSAESAPILQQSARIKAASTIIFRSSPCIRANLLTWYSAEKSLD